MSHKTIPHAVDRLRHMRGNRVLWLDADPSGILFDRSTTGLSPEQSLREFAAACYDGAAIAAIVGQQVASGCDLLRTPTQDTMHYILEGALELSHLGTICALHAKLLCGVVRLAEMRSKRDMFTVGAVSPASADLRLGMHTQQQHDSLGAEAIAKIISEQVRAFATERVDCISLEGASTTAPGWYR